MFDTIKWTNEQHEPIWLVIVHKINQISLFMHKLLSVSLSILNHLSHPLSIGMYAYSGLQYLKRLTETGIIAT